MQFADFNMIASIGAFGFGFMQVYFFLFVVLPRCAAGRRRRKALGSGRRPGMGSAVAGAVPHLRDAAQAGRNRHQGDRLRRRA
jgi:hypothetical protein